jgi:hypothetical protein
LSSFYKDEEEGFALKWWEKILARLHWLTWRATVAAVPHSFRHRPDCGHRGKEYLWKAKDGCWGRVCLVCHVASVWSPSYMPDVVQITKLRFEGSELRSE